MSEPSFDITAKQVATNEQSAAARLDRPTEDRLYRLFKTFFREAEEQRRWTVWADIPWEEVSTAPSADLIEAVLHSYREDLFLPDYSADALRVLRASRGRAWFVTRWSYEEGKHMLALNEWLTRSHSMTDADVREMTEAHLRTFRWEPPYEDGLCMLTDMLLWELQEIERYTALHDKAEAAGDRALVVATERILGDETAHRDFQRTALGICAETYRERILDAIAQVAQAQEYPGGASALQTLLEVPGL